VPSLYLLLDDFATATGMSGKEHND